MSNQERNALGAGCNGSIKNNILPLLHTPGHKIGAEAPESKMTG